jgi:H+/Cl- antiporter ClcA
VPNKEDKDRIRDEVRREIEEEKLRTKIRREIEIEDKYKEERRRYESRSDLFRKVHITIAIVGSIGLILGLMSWMASVVTFFNSFADPRVTVNDSIPWFCVGAIMILVCIILLIVYWFMSRAKT